MAPKVIRGAVLMENPQYLVGMLDQVGGKFQTNDAVYGHAGTLGHVEQARSQYLRSNMVWRKPFKWDGNDMYGQRLANGVYLYRVLTNLNGKSLEKYKAQGDKTDQYFNKGYGKMYLLK